MPAMNKLTTKRKCFSSTDQLARIQMVIRENWEEVILATKTKNKSSQE
jgi:hypothetical protein